MSTETYALSTALEALDAAQDFLRARDRGIAPYDPDYCKLQSALALVDEALAAINDHRRSDAMLTVDWTTAPPEKMNPCPDCGGIATLLYDSVLDDGKEIALVSLMLDPHQPVAVVLLSLGGEGLSFMLSMRRQGGGIASRFMRDDEIQERGFGKLGALPRKQALKHPDKDTVFALLDRVCTVDPRVRDHFGMKTNTTH